MTVEVLCFAGCPNAPAALALVRRCMAKLGVEVGVVVRDGDYPSPSVRVDGRDVVNEPVAAERACRLDLPTEEHVMTALREAMR